MLFSFFRAQLLISLSYKTINMKKAIFTITLAIFAIAGNAQDNSSSKAKTEKDQKPSTTATSAGNNTAPIVHENLSDKSTKSNESPKEVSPKKSGTRMAINEKGLPGNSKTSSPKKDEKNTNGTK